MAQPETPSTPVTPSTKDYTIVPFINIYVDKALPESKRSRTCNLIIEAAGTAPESTLFNLFLNTYGLKGLEHLEVWGDKDVNGCKYMFNAVTFLLKFLKNDFSLINRFRGSSKIQSFCRVSPTKIEAPIIYYDASSSNGMVYSVLTRYGHSTLPYDALIKLNTIICKVKTYTSKDESTFDSRRRDLNFVDDIKELRLIVTNLINCFIFTLSETTSLIDSKLKPIEAILTEFTEYDLFDTACTRKIVAKIALKIETSLYLNREACNKSTLYFNP